MRAYWTDRKPDGTPITDGRLCRVVDPEDGSIPIRVYGRTEEEVYSKIERTMMTAQSTLTTVRQAAVNNTPPVHPVERAANDPAILSADEIMSQTLAQQNPATAAEAAAKLSAHHYAVERQKRESFKAVCAHWAEQHPDFYQNPTNQTLLMQKALITAGNDMTRVTAEMLNLCYRELQALGALVTEADTQQASNGHQPSAAPPDGNLESVPARPQSGVVSTTGHRSNRLGGPQAPRWQPKFTQAELNRMTTAETAALNKPTHPRHKEFVEACDYWYSGAQATA